MRAFNCDHCGHLVFFDSTRCVHCGSTLAFVPEWLRMAALTPAHPSTGAPSAPTHAIAPTALWQAIDTDSATPSHWRLCANHMAYQACNFAVPADDPQPLCISCRQTRWLPDLSDPANLRRWKVIEDAKRRLFYTLARLHLTRLDGVAAPEFEFLADLPGQPVMTGHRSGTIVLNVAEADDEERARRRVALHEPYRTLVGHLRHESGHYYWDILVQAHPHALAQFRALFGDERQDYAQALQAHYHVGPAGPPGWEAQHVSAYSTAHPWEDWAETWAHYLHIVDLMETAASYRTQLMIPGEQGPHTVQDPFDPAGRDFDAMIRAWVPLTLLLNSLNRSLGQDHAYPFALSSGAITKLRFVHDLLTPYQPAAI
ncbi:MAG: putative zinc-binding peptidase [Comamonas sp.]